MKRLLLTAVALLVGSSLCFAQPYSNTAATTTKSASGKIQSVTEADAAKGTKSEIIITGNDNKQLTFLVKTSTTIYNASGSPTTLKGLKKDDQVKVNYATSAAGVMEASSVYEVK